jgi:hypothetical protein
MADVGSFGVFIPIIALSIPVVAMLTRSMQRMAQLRVEEARIRAGSSGDEEIQQLRDEVERLRGEMVEIQERMDFTERLLARGSDQGQKPS